MADWVSAAAPCTTRYIPFPYFISTQFEEDGRVDSVQVIESVECAKELVALATVTNLSSP
jgi:hypothetical protein